MLTHNVREQYNAQPLQSILTEFVNVVETTNGQLTDLNAYYPLLQFAVTDFTPTVITFASHAELSITE